MTSTRMQVPRLFDGDWDSAIICSYGADLTFFEHDLWRQLHRTKNRIVLADRQQVDRRLRDTGRLNQPRHLNHSYALARVISDHAAHAKLILMMRHDSGVLAVGSGNLSLNGYTSQAECFTTYHLTEDDQTHLSEFVAVKTFLDRLIDCGAVESVIGQLLEQAWSDAPWIYRNTSGESLVRHNLDRSLLTQFIESIADRQVNELVVHAPFYDHRCEALESLLKRTSPGQVQVLLQERLTSVDPVRLQQVLATSAAPFDIRSVRAEEDGAVLHAKFIIARCGDVDVCLQGSPNISTPALEATHPSGNIELANLLVGDRGSFDHLVNDLVVSGPVAIDALGLEILATGDDVIELSTPVSELKWRSPNLTGVFGISVYRPPELLIGDESVDVLRWELGDASGGTTDFVATLDAPFANLLAHVASLVFRFDGQLSSSPCFPFHIDALSSLARGHGRAEMLKRAADFAIDDEELPELLLQLEEALIIDGSSLWRLNKSTPPLTEPDGGEQIAYEDLDWDTIQSHPKVAQYRRVMRSEAMAETDALGVILGSISSRFKAEVALRRGEVVLLPPDGLDISDPVALAEDEDLADELGEQLEQGRVSDHARNRRRFVSFIQRVTKGITDPDFVARVGSSVVIPSYVVFNHVCWKVLQLDLADPVTVARSQAEIWRFFWGSVGDTGYLESLTQAEQLAALEILDSHHAEAVLLCSLFVACRSVEHAGTDRDIRQVRDTWRAVLASDLWQPSSSSVADAATLLADDCDSPQALVDALRGIAFTTIRNEQREVVADALGLPASSVLVTRDRVNRPGVGEQTIDEIFVIENGDAPIDNQRCIDAVMAVRTNRLTADSNYIRIEIPDIDSVIFADFDADSLVLANRATGAITEGKCPVPAVPRWQEGLVLLHDLAS